MGDDVVDKGVQEAVRADAPVQRADLRGRPVAGRGDEVVGNQRIAVVRLVLVHAAQGVEADVVVDEDVVLDEPARAHLQAEGGAAHEDRVAHRHVVEPELEIDVVAVHARRLPALERAVGPIVRRPAVVVEEGVLKKQALRPGNVETGHAVDMRRPVAVLAPGPWLFAPDVVEVRVSDRDPVGTFRPAQNDKLVFR
jgi:hypothetical protein